MSIVEIRDPNLNQQEILERITTLIQGKFPPDFSAVGPDSLRSAQADVPQTGETQTVNYETMIDLIMMHQLEETQFSSDTPIIGTWIVRLREFWNWMSTKWYVRPILRQQSTINGQMILLLIEMNTLLRESKKNVALLEEKVNHLETVLASNGQHEK